MKGARERERKSAAWERDEGGPAAGVRTLCMRFSRPGGGRREGREGSRAVGWFRRLADDGGFGEVVVAAAEGVVPTVAAGVGAGGEGGRRLPRRVVNLSAALQRRRGRYYFLLFSTSSSSTSRSFSSSFWSQRVFARSSRLRHSSPVLPVPPLRGAACCSPPVLFLVVPSFRSARLNTLLRRYPPCFDPSSYPFFVHSLARLPRSRDLAFNDRSCVYTRSLFLSLFLPLWLGKQSARCLLSSHSTCLLTQASCPPRSISLVACA